MASRRRRNVDALKLPGTSELADYDEVVVYDDHDGRHRDESKTQSPRDQEALAAQVIQTRAKHLSLQGAPDALPSNSSEERSLPKMDGDGSLFKQTRLKQFPINSKRIGAAQESSLSLLFDKLDACLPQSGALSSASASITTMLNTSSCFELSEQLPLPIFSAEGTSSSSSSGYSNNEFSKSNTIIDRKKSQVRPQSVSPPSKRSRPVIAASRVENSKSTTVPAPSAPSARGSAVRDLLLDRPKHWGNSTSRTAARPQPLNRSAATVGAPAVGASKIHTQPIISQSQSRSQSFRPTWLQKPTRAVEDDESAALEETNELDVEQRAAAAGSDGSKTSLSLVSGHRPSLGFDISAASLSPDASPARSSRRSKGRSSHGALLTLFDKIGRGTDSAVLRLQHVQPTHGYDDPRNRAQTCVLATVLRQEPSVPPFKAVLAYVHDVREPKALDGKAPAEAQVVSDDGRATGCCMPGRHLNGQLAFIYFTDSPCGPERTPIVGRVIRMYDTLATEAGLVCTQVYEPVFPQETVEAVPLAAVKAARERPLQCFDSTF